MYLIYKLTQYPLLSYITSWYACAKWPSQWISSNVSTQSMQTLDKHTLCNNNHVHNHQTLIIELPYSCWYLRYSYNLSAMWSPHVREPSYSQCAIYNIIVLTIHSSLPSSLKIGIINVAWCSQLIIVSVLKLVKVAKRIGLKTSLRFWFPRWASNPRQFCQALYIKKGLCHKHGITLMQILIIYNKCCDSFYNNTFLLIF